MSARAARTPSLLSWNGLVYYGETAGFFCAWIAGIAALVYASGTPDPPARPVDTVAAVDAGGR